MKYQTYNRAAKKRNSEPKIGSIGSSWYPEG